jgi:hypothetical protein
MEPYVKRYLTLSFHYIYVRFFGALTYYELYRRGWATQELSSRPLVQKKSRSEGICVAVPIQSHFRCSLSAEDLSVLKRSTVSSLEAAYGKAIQIMADAQLVHLEGFSQRARWFCL